VVQRIGETIKSSGMRQMKRFVVERRWLDCQAVLGEGLSTRPAGARTAQIVWLGHIIGDQVARAVCTMIAAELSALP